MTLRLILIRHAKSSWDDAGMDDHARPLNARGQADAPRVGRWLSDNGFAPDLVLCSDATRTRQTLGLILPELPVRPEVRYLPQLYHADASTMLATLQPETARVVAMVGHNPGIGTLACGIVHARPDQPRYRAFPTAATAVIDFDLASWADVRPGMGHVVGFTVPHDMAD
jgi:phosphohistidine phosphatase